MSTVVRSRSAGIASWWSALRQLADLRPEMTVETLALVAAGFFTLFALIGLCEECRTA